MRKPTNNSKAIRNILKSLKALEPVFAEDLMSVPVAVKASREMAKTNAKESKSRLNRDLRTLLCGNEEEAGSAFVMYITGPDAKRFATIADRETAGAVNVSMAAMYRRLAELVAPSIGGTFQFGQAQLMGVVNGLETIGRELEISNIPTPSLLEFVHVSEDGQLSMDKLTNTIRDIIVAGRGGNQLARLYIEHAIIEAVTLRGTEEVRAVVPVFITDATPEEIEDLQDKLMGGNSTVIEPSFPPLPKLEEGVDPVAAGAAADLKLVMETMKGVLKELSAAQP